MPEEERNLMHATEPNNEKNTVTQPSSPACVYSVETLMALQKMLENGIPQPGERLPRQSPRPPALESNPQHTGRLLFVQPVTEPRTTWKEYVRRVFMKLRRTEEEDKGHSAQQNG